MKDSKFPMHGPLRVSPVTPRYFTDDSGRAIYLTGSHVHGALVDHVMLNDGSPQEVIDFDAYIADMAAHGHNFLRLWTRESGFGPGHSTPPAMTRTEPFPYVDVNQDGHLGDHPVYDLNKFNTAYFQRLRDRVIKAGENGIYVSVMLFEGWSLDSRRRNPDGYPFAGHPFHKANNINGIDGNPEGIVESHMDVMADVNPMVTEEHLRVHTLDIPEITAYQKKYIKRVIETVNDLDNVMYEIANEAFRWSRYWQYEMIDFIHDTERNMPKQHPVWMSHLVQAQNESLFVSPAEAISPGVEDVSEDYCQNPPASDGRKVILADTDHLGGFWGTSQWAWKSFMRGLNPIFMDFWGEMRNMGAYEDEAHPVSNLFGRQQYMLPKNWGEPVRTALGQTRMFAERIDLVHALPSGNLSSTGYCLAVPGKEYLVYAPAAGQFRVRLFGARGPFSVEWFNPNTGETIPGEPFEGGTAFDFTPPYLGEVVLYLKKIGEAIH